MPITHANVMCVDVALKMDGSAGPKLRSVKRAADVDELLAVP